MSSKTGIVYHDRFLDHDTGVSHPERPDRLRSITAQLKSQSLWSEIHHLMIDPADEEHILRVHDPRHLRFIRESCAVGRRLLDEGDTVVSAQSYAVALLAAGGVLAAVDAVVQSTLRNAFCAIRPPGHHACRDRVMGFCLFNNIAIAARYAQSVHRIKRIVIVDWDVHHGNGTQEIFYEDATVLYISTHQYPLWPGTGSRDERGAGAGSGYTLNIPLRPGSGEDEYVAAFQTQILPAIDAFRPDLFLISAGFDAHMDDPLASMNLTEDSFQKMTALIAESARKHCEGRIVSLLEGGYNLPALASSVELHVRTLMDVS